MTGPGPDLATRLRPWFEVAIATSPRATYDSEHILYVSDRGGLPEVWSAPREGGEPRRAFASAERVGLVLPSPFGPHAVATVDRGGNESWSVVMWDLEGPGSKVEPRALTHQPEAIHEPGDWRDDHHLVLRSNERDRRYFDICEIDVDAPTAKPVVRLQGDGWHEVAAVRDGSILVARLNSNLDVDLILVQEGRNVVLTPHTGELTIRGADLLGGDIYAAANPGREMTALVRYRPGRTTPEFLKEYAADVELVRTSPRGSAVALTINRQGWSELHIFDTATGEDRGLTSGPRGVIDGLAWFPDGSRVVYALSTPGEGQEVYVRNVETGKEKRFTRSPVPPPSRTPDPKLVTVRATDGLSVPYWEYVPAGRPPRGTIVILHGGPEAQARPGFSRMQAFLVAEGWRVVAPNVRGSSGYGRTYIHADDVERRPDAVRDVRDVVASLVKAGKATPGKIGVYGGSYGGYLVLAALTSYPELFGAAVELVGIANFVTFLEKTGPWRRALREAEYGSLAKDRALLERISPLSHADKIRTPLMVIHGANDPRVPIGEAEQIVASLKRRGVPVEFIRLENAGHHIVRRDDQLGSYGAAAEFLARHLDASSPP